VAIVRKHLLQLEQFRSERAFQQTRSVRSEQRITERMGAPRGQVQVAVGGGDDQLGVSLLEGQARAHDPAAVPERPPLRLVLEARRLEVGGHEDEVLAELLGDGPEGVARSVEGVRLVDGHIEAPHEDEVVDRDVVPAVDGLVMSQDREEGVDAAREEGAGSLRARGLGRGDVRGLDGDEMKRRVPVLPQLDEPVDVLEEERIDRIVDLEPLANRRREGRQADQPGVAGAAQAVAVLGGHVEPVGLRWERALVVPDMPGQANPTRPERGLGDGGVRELHTCLQPIATVRPTRVPTPPSRRQSNPFRGPLVGGIRADGREPPECPAEEGSAGGRRAPRERRQRRRGASGIFAGLDDVARDGSGMTWPAGSGSRADPPVSETTTSSKSSSS
jgi:hypothetical protein